MSIAASWSNSTFDLGNQPWLKDSQKLVEKVLVFLEKSEAVLEAVLDLIKIAAAAYLNPIKALISVLLATIRLVINQLRAMGLYLLPVIPDFTGDWQNSLTSISGGFNNFESKIVAKLIDRKDPSYPAMVGPNLGFCLIFSVGAASASDLLNAIFGIVSLFSQDFWSKWWNAMPPTVDLKARPALVTGANDINIVFPSINFLDALDPNAIVVEWKIAEPVTPRNTPGILRSIQNATPNLFTPSYLVERSEFPDGQVIPFEVESQTSEEAKSAQTSSSQPDAKSFTNLLDVDRSTTYKFFEVRRKLQEETQQFFRSFQFVDKKVDPGKTYYYRVRPYFKAPFFIGNYTKDKNLSEFISETDLFSYSDGGMVYLDPYNGVVGLPSNTVSAVLPTPISSLGGFSPYYDTYRSLMLGLLLNFHMPEPVNDGNANHAALSTGWGSMSSVVGYFRYSYVQNIPSSLPQYIPISTGQEGVASGLVTNTQANIGVRRLLERIMPAVYSNSVALESLATKWSKVKPTVDGWLVFNPLDSVFGTPSIAKTNGSVAYDWALSPFSGNDSVSFLDVAWKAPAWYAPLPVTEITVAERQALADFVSEALLYANSALTSYLAWTKISLSDFIAPSLFTYLDWTEQFVASLLKAADDLVADIEETIKEIQQYIVRLTKVFEDLQRLLDYLNVAFSANLLFITDTQMNTASLVRSIRSAQNKPGVVERDGTTVTLNNGLFVGAVLVGIMPNLAQDAAGTAEAVRAALQFGDTTNAIENVTTAFNDTVEAFRTIFNT